MKQLTLPLFLLGSTLVLSCKNNTEEKKTPEKENTTISVERLQDSIQKLSDDLAEERYFDISFNEDARYFFHENGIDEPEDYYKISQENMVEYKEFVKKNPNELTTKCLNYLLNNYKNKKSEVIGQEIDIIIEKEMKEKFEIEEVWTF